MNSPGQTLYPTPVLSILYLYVKHTVLLANINLKKKKVCIKNCVKIKGKVLYIVKKKKLAQENTWHKYKTNHVPQTHCSLSNYPHVPSCHLQIRHCSQGNSYTCQNNTVVSNITLLLPQSINLSITCCQFTLPYKTHNTCFLPGPKTTHKTLGS